MANAIEVVYKKGVMGIKRRFIAIILLVSLAMVLVAMGGCGIKSSTTTQEQQKEDTTQKKSEQTTEGKVINIGETATVEGQVPGRL
jgi:hypothetical protein